MRSKLWISYHRITLLCCTALMILSAQVIAQQNKSLSLVDALKEWQDHYKLIVNYDYEALSNYTDIITLPYKGKEDDLNHILLSTPFSFVRSTDIYTLYITSAERKQLCGTIVDESGSPMPYASIQLIGANSGTSSDSIGRFELTAEILKNDQLLVSFIGYKDRTLYVDELAPDCSTIVLYIDEELYLTDVVIKDYLMNGISTTANYGSTDLNYNILSRDHTSTEHDVLGFLQLLPGVNSTDDSATNLNIRGTTPDQNLILWENTTLYDPGHLFGMISSINPYSIDQVSLHKGIYDPKYENRVGGLVNISLPGEVPFMPSYSVGTSLTEAHLNVESPIVSDRLGLYVGARRSINSLIKTIAFNNYFNTIFQNTKVETNLEEATEGFIDAENQLTFWDINAKLLYQPIDQVSTSISYLSVSNEFNLRSSFFDDDLSSIDMLDYSSEVLTLNTSVSWSSTIQSSVSYSLSEYDNAYQLDLNDDFDDQTIYNYNNLNRIKDATLSINNQYKWSDWVELNFGYIRDQKKVQYDILEASDFEPGFNDSFNQETSFNHLYSSLIYRPVNHHINISLKGSNPIVEPDFWLYSPRLFYSYNWSSGVQIKTSAGRVYQFITQNRDFGITDIISTNFWLLTDLQPESILYADKFSLGLACSKSGWLMDVEVYHHNMRNLSIINSTIIDPLELENPLGLNATGIELLIKKQWSHFGLWANYSLNNNYYIGEDIVQSTPSEIDQRHRLSVVSTLDFSDFRINLTYQYKSGLPFTEPTGIGSFQVDEETFYEFNYDNGINQEELPDYHRLDLSFSWNKKAGKRLFESSVSLINLANHENIGELVSLIDDDEDELGNTIPVEFRFEKRLLGFTPRIMLRMSF